MVQTKLIDDLVYECENDLYLYADDSALFCEIKSNDDSVAKTASLNIALNQSLVASVAK